MKKVNALAIALFFLCFSAFAQMNLPQPSPAAMAKGRIGMTDITIDYSSPGVKGRTIFGDLEKWDVAWRAGANSATKITFSTDVKVGGKDLKAGSYSIYLTPHQNKAWEWHFQDPAKSVFSYQDQESLRKEDIARIDAVKEEAPLQERLVYFVSPNEEAKGMVTLYWEKMKVSFEVTVSVADQKKVHVEEVLAKMAGAWRTYQDAALFYMDTNLDKSLQLIDQSIGLRPGYFWNHWVKAQIMAKKGNYDSALDLVMAAQEVGEAKPDGAYDFFKGQLEAHKNEWMPKASKEWAKAYAKKKK